MNVKKVNQTNLSMASKIIKRGAILVAVCVLAIVGFYLSMIATSDSLSYEQDQTIDKAINILAEKGFDDEVFYLRYVTSYRKNDNWLNASTREENAFAATNYPFEIMTVYPDFFDKTTDDTERAAILLHEAKHLQGKDEKDAYEFVWQNRQKIGWTSENYATSPVWESVRRQTREFVPNIFVCNFKEFLDCTE